MTIDASFFDTAKGLLIVTAPDMPPELWAVPAFVLGILLVTAIIDAFTKIVPDVLIFAGLMIATGLLGFFASWDIAAQHLQVAIAVTVAIWGMNELWYRSFHHEALGMGDAKWTLLAVTCFGVIPALLAWGGGAVIAAIFMIGMRLFRCPIKRVTFAPFLLIGLCAGLYWLRLRA